MIVIIQINLCYLVLCQLNVAEQVSHTKTGDTGLDLATELTR